MNTNVKNTIDIKNVKSLPAPLGRAGEGSLSDDDKQDIVYIIKEAILQMGSATAIANRCGVSPATISQIEKGQYITQGDAMWRKIGNVLGWNKNTWVIVEDITNTRTMLGVLEDAQQNSLFIPVAERAGAGKSTGIQAFLAKNKAGNVYHLECWTWGPKEFLTRLRTKIGMPALRGMFTVNDMLDQIIHHFKMRKGKPLLIIDQANSLPHSSLILMNHIYNELKGRLGCVIAGTENLEQKIERGIKNRHQGYDELADRLGRTYIHLTGYLFSDVKKICSANGITDPELQKNIWAECNPVNKIIEVENARGEKESKSIRIIESGRVMERKILKYNMLTSLSNGEGHGEPLTAKTA